MTVVYTAVLGGSDTLKQAPMDCADRCYCYTDRPDQDPKGWTLRPWSILENSRWDAWRLRCRPDLLFPTADRTLWLDASFEMLNVAALLNESSDADMAGLRHHERNSCYEEGDELIKIGQSAKGDVVDQLKDYRRSGFRPTVLTTSGILVRQRTKTVAAFNRLWEREIDANAGDNTQLSLDYSAWKVGVDITHLRGTYPDNPYVRYDAEDHHLHRRPYR